MTIFDLLQLTIDRKASDLHLISGYYPSIRVNGELIQLKTLEIITSESSQKLILSLLNEEQKTNFLANHEIDLSYEYEKNRFRINVYFSKGSICASIRLIPRSIKTIEELGLPSSFHNFTKLQQGLVLVTGQTGEGKSTTLASIINEINLNYAKHIVTIEDPIEYVYPANKSIVSQRELHYDTHSWSLALKSVLREDSDVVMVGEMRDTETMQLVLTIAETGHLVFSTLHTSSTSEVMNRIIDVFPAHQQNQIKIQLASVLKAVIAQRLIPTINLNQRVPAVEILMNIPAVAATIREGRTHQLDNILETSEEKGLILFEKSLATLYHKGLISKEIALMYANKESEMKKFL